MNLKGSLRSRRSLFCHISNLQHLQDQLSHSLTRWYFMIPNIKHASGDSFARWEYIHAATKNIYTQPVILTGLASEIDCLYQNNTQVTKG